MQDVGKSVIILGNNMPYPKPDIEMVNKVKDFRAKGLSFRQIAKLLEKDVKTVYRWASYSVGKLSTGKPLRVGKRAV